MSFIDTTYDYDGTEKVLLIDGDLPEGTSINYTNNEGVNAGEHNATAVISGQNYHTLTLTATLKINKIEDLDHMIRDLKADKQVIDVFRNTQ